MNDENIIIEELNYFDDDSNEINDEISKNDKLKRNLEIKKYDRMIKDIISSIEDGTIVLTPEYQRNYLWDNKKASKLIESILLNIPIPVIYASEEKDGKWNVVDGLQRLNSLHRFYKDEFTLTGLEVLSELNNQKYSDLTDNLKSKIDRGDLSIILLLDSSSPDIQYDIFMRLNTGAIQLNQQELRNCLYRGNLNDLLKDIMINNEDFKSLFNVKSLSKRMLDVEIILRYLAFSDNYNSKEKRFENYDGRIKNILNEFMLKYQNADEKTLEKIKSKFDESIKKSREVFGESAFRKINYSGKYETRINRPLYETVMICFEKYTQEELLSKKDEIIDKTVQLLQNPEFNDLITYATGNASKTNKRIFTYSNLLEEIFNK